MNYLMMMINDLDHEDDLSSRGGAMSSTGGLDLEAAESASALTARPRVGVGRCQTLKSAQMSSACTPKASI